MAVTVPFRQFFRKLSQNSLKVVRHKHSWTHGLDGETCWRSLDEQLLLRDALPSVQTLLILRSKIVSDPDAPEDELEFNPDAVEIELARAFFPKVEWEIGKPLSLLNEHKGPIDIVVNCLPLVSKSSVSIELAGIEGKPIKLRDKLANLILASATACLSVDGIGAFYSLG